MVCFIRFLNERLKTSLEHSMTVVLLETNEFRRKVAPPSQKNSLTVFEDFPVVFSKRLVSHEIQFLASFL